MKYVAVIFLAFLGIIELVLRIAVVLGSMLVVFILNDDIFDCECFKIIRMILK